MTNPVRAVTRDGAGGVGSLKIIKYMNNRMIAAVGAVIALNCIDLRADVFLGDPNPSNGWSTTSVVGANVSSYHFRPGDNPQQDGSRVVNGSGIDVATGSLHDTDYHNMWLSGGTDTSPSITFLFNQAYNLTSLVLWNYNETYSPFYDSTAPGLKSGTIEISLNGTDWTTVYDTAVDDFVPKATGLGSEVADFVLNLNQVSAQYVRINILENWGGTSTFSGLSEVRFTTVPEPGTLGLIALAALAGIYFAKRRAFCNRFGG